MDVPATSLIATGVEIRAVALRELRSDPSWRRPVLARQHLLIVITGGHATAQIDFRHYSCRSGTVLRVRPGQAVRCPLLSERDVVAVEWAGDIPDDTCQDQAFQAGTGQSHWQLTGEDQAAVTNEISQLVADCRRHPDDGPARLLRRHQLAVVLLRLALLSDDVEQAVRAGRHTGPTGGTAELATFRRLWSEVERRHTHTRRVEDYADRLGCSVRTLTRACLAVTGRSAKQVIDQRVALQAMRLLAATDEPIAALGRRLGFPEPTNFGRFFVRETGRSPGAFRSSPEDPRYPAAERTGRTAGADTRPLAMPAAPA